MAISTAVYETYVTNGDGLPLDLIIWRRYRRKTPGLVEATYGFNPGLAQLGMFLPRGTQIKIPVVAPATVTQLPVVRLW
jgi:phage tail protein X